MFKTFAAALLAASVIASPVLAAGHRPGYRVEARDRPK